MADRDSLEKIIFNYLSNALKFCKGNPIELALREENEKIIISVKDQGNGIPEEKQSQIFEIFQQLDKSTEYGGFGIGLNLVKKLTEKMDGKAGVSSSLGKGSEFWISFDKY